VATARNRPELAEAPFDGVAFLVPSAIEGRRAAARAARVAAMRFLVLPDGDDRLDAAAAQVGAVGSGGVGFVALRVTRPTIYRQLNKCA
jgi:hypothetical protein